MLIRNPHGPLRPHDRRSAYSSDPEAVSFEAKCGARYELRGRSRSVFDLGAAASRPFPESHHGSSQQGVSMFAFVLASVRKFIQSDSAQDAFEYLLVIGGVSVAIVLVMVSPLGNDIVYGVVNGVCSAIDQVIEVGSCTFGASST